MDCWSLFVDMTRESMVLRAAKPEWIGGGTKAKMAMATTHKIRRSSRPKTSTDEIRWPSSPSPFASIRSYHLARFSARSLPPPRRRMHLMAVEVAVAIVILVPVALSLGRSSSWPSSSLCTRRPPSLKTQVLPAALTSRWRAALSLPLAKKYVPMAMMASPPAIVPQGPQILHFAYLRISAETSTSMLNVDFSLSPPPTMREI